jgi:hypothetical protein
MKREFGKKLMDNRAAAVGPHWRGGHVSGAYIPGHGTPTVILFGRAQLPGHRDPIWAVLGKRGEPKKPTGRRLKKEGSFGRRSCVVCAGDHRISSPFVSAVSCPSVAATFDCAPLEPRAVELSGEILRSNIESNASASMCERVDDFQSGAR